MQLSFSEDDNRNLETEQLYKTKKLQLFQLMNVTVLTDDVILENTLNQNTIGTTENVLYNPRIKRAELQYQNSLKSISLERAKICRYYQLIMGIPLFIIKP